MAKRQPVADARPTVRVGEQSLERGAGGELHQTAGTDAPALTTAQGMPVADDQNTLRISAGA